MKNELYMERFHGNGLKNLNSAVILNRTTPKKNLELEDGIKSLSRKFELNRTRNRFFLNQTKFGKKILNALHDKSEFTTFDLLSHRNDLVETTYWTDQQEQWINGNAELGHHTFSPGLYWNKPKTYLSMEPQFVYLRQEKSEGNISSESVQLSMTPLLRWYSRPPGRAARVTFKRLAAQIAGKRTA